MASYAMDAETVKKKSKKTFSTKASEILLEHVAEQQCQIFDAVGLGSDLRFEAADVLGQALEVENHLLHLSVFPPTTEDGPRGAQTGSRISPPSRRKR